MKIRYLIAPVLIFSLFAKCRIFEKTGKAIIIPLRIEKNVERGPLGSTYLLFSGIGENDFAHYKLADSLGVNSFQISTFDFDREKKLVEDFRYGKIDTSRFLQYVKLYSIDTNLHARKQPSDAEVMIFIGSNKAKDCFLLPDRNNNNSFADDSVIILKNYYNDTIKPFLDNLPLIAFRGLSFSYNNKKFEKTLRIRLMPYKPKVLREIDSMENSFNELQLFLISEEHSAGKFTIKKENYKVSVRNKDPKLLYDPTNTLIGFSKAGEKFRTMAEGYVPYSINDNFYLGKRKFHIEGISPFGDTLMIKYMGKKNKQTGFNSGEVMANFSFKDILSDKPIELKDLLKNNKFLLIDFWGSWCKPCLAGFTSLKREFDTLEKRDVDFLGIVYDDSSSFSQVKDILAKHEIQWNQYFVDRKLGNSIVDTLKVVSFPTFILVDSKAKIVYRGAGHSGFAEVIRLMKNE